MNKFDSLILKCPICSARMYQNNEKTLFCEGQRVHSYDISASGYVNLSTPRQCGGGDNKDAVRARTAFLDLDFYLPIADKTIQLLKQFVSINKKVIDAGCGEGYYTSKIAESGFSTVGFDISKMAIEAAAKRVKRENISNAAFAVASVYELPIFDSSAGAIINIFAPCVEPEYLRVLEDEGILIVVHAGKDHLMGLKKHLYDNIYENDERADLPKSMELIAEEKFDYDISVKGNRNIKNLFAMTPYYWRTSMEDAKKLDNLEELQTKIDIIFSIFKKKVDGKRNG